MMEKNFRASSSDYNRTWDNGVGHSLGSGRFAGQTRNRRLTDKTIEQTTYGYATIHDTGMVATISEMIQKDIIDAQIKRWDNRYVQS